MLHILLAYVAPLIGLLTFVLVAAASWATFKSSTVSQLHQALTISKDLADTAIKHVDSLKQEVEALRRAQSVQDHRIVRVEVDLERKTRLLNAERNEKQKMELIIGIMSKAIPPAARAKADELIQELGTERRAFQEEQEAWEDAQTTSQSLWNYRRGGSNGVIPALPNER